MFVLTSNITIGAFKDVKPSSVKVQKSILQFVDKAVIKLPATALLRRSGFPITFSETAKLFKEGDAVKIDLGYNGYLKTEFEGFVSRINFTMPVEIECEGYSYQLRIKSYQPKTFVKTRLLDILKYIVADTGIVLDEKQIPSFHIEKFLIKGENGVELLEKIKKDYAPIYVIFTGNVLYAGLLGLDYKNLKGFPQKANTNYRIGWNVIKDNNLKQRKAANQNIYFHYIGQKKDGSKIHAYAGNKNGVLKTVTLHDVIDQKSLQAMADANLLHKSYDGYEGKITAFLQPYCEPAYTTELTDEKYPERSGNYLVESTEVSYGTSGARRIVGIGLKL